MSNNFFFGCTVLFEEYGGILLIEKHENQNLAFYGDFIRFKYANFCWVVVKILLPKIFPYFDRVMSEISHIYHEFNHKVFIIKVIFQGVSLFLGHPVENRSILHENRLPYNPFHREWKKVGYCMAEWVRDSLSIHKVRVRFRSPSTLFCLQRKTQIFFANSIFFSKNFIKTHI